MKYLVSTAALVALSLSLLAQAAPPAYADGHWELGEKKIGKRMNEMGQEEEDKDLVKSDNRSNPQVTASNLEVKCTSSRDDYTAGTAGSATATVVQEVIWRSGPNTAPVARYFRVDITRGVVAKALPYRNLALPVEDTAGLAQGSASTPGPAGSAVNFSVPTMNYEDEAIQQNQVHDVYDTGGDPPTVSPGQDYLFELYFQLYAFSSADTLAVAEAAVWLPGGGALPLPVVTYKNKACNAEGRAYIKVADLQNYTPPVP